MLHTNSNKSLQVDIVTLTEKENPSDLLETHFLLALTR